MADRERDFWKRELADTVFTGLSGKLSPFDEINIGRRYGALRIREKFCKGLDLPPIDTRSCTISYARRLGATEEEAEAVVRGLKEVKGLEERERIEIQQARPPEGLLGKIKRLFKAR